MTPVKKLLVFPVTVHIPVAAPTNRQLLGLGDLHKGLGNRLEAFDIVEVDGIRYDIESHGWNVVVGRLSKASLAKAAFERLLLLCAASLSIEDHEVDFLDRLIDKRLKRGVQFGSGFE